MVDDMESLLYVILYLALLRLPLVDSTKARFALTLFESKEIEHGRPSSQAKKNNLRDGRHTDDVQWQNAPLQYWIDNMLYLLRPDTEHTRRQERTIDVRGKQWKSVDVKTFWEGFLRRWGVNLPMNDRQSTIPSLGGSSRHASRDVIGEPNHPTMASPSHSGT